MDGPRGARSLMRRGHRRSGAFMYAACWCGPYSWPLALMESADRRLINASRSTAPKALRVLSIPGPTGRAITSSLPSQLVKPSGPAYAAAAAFGDRKVPPRTINAQAIRAILLATAMMTTFGGRRFCNASIQSAPVAARALAKRTALPAPT